MNRLKKFVSLLLTAVMVLAMAAPAFAAETTYTISVAEGDTHTYEVYQIFTGDFSGDTLSNVKWGENGTGTKGEAVDATILTALADVNSGTYAEKMAVVNNYVDLNNTTAVAEVTKDSSYTAAPGYYLLKDKDKTVTGNDTYNLYLENLVNEDVTVSPKREVPTSEKKVKDTNDSVANSTTGWQDSADYDIGDKVPFQLKGTLPDDYANYKEYYLAFHDVESKGLTFDSTSVKVYVDGYEITTGFEVVTTGLTDGCTFEVRFADMKTITEVVAKANSVITVEYESELNENAVLGSAGNPNTMHMEFSNNPNQEAGGTPETGKTPDDTVIVFTYKVVVSKTDGTNPLAGAGFTLEKKNAAGEWVAVGEEIVSTEEHPLTTFTFSGLDDGDYRLTETTTPAGYNTIAPIEFTVTADHDIESDDPKLTSLSGKATTGEITFTPSTTDGSLTTTVVNKAGTTLPETGGIGTTIFYILGTILVLGAAVLLVTKKRMGNVEK